MFRLGLIFSWDQDQTCHVQLNSPGPKYWEKKRKKSTNGGTNQLNIKIC